MEVMLHILMFIETLQSIYWILNNLMYPQVKDMYSSESKCFGCFTLSHISVFLYSCDWVFLALTLHNLRKVINNPVEGILKPRVRINLYIVITIIASCITTVLCYMSAVFGRSVIFLNQADADLFY